MQQSYAFLAKQLAVFRQPVVILDLEATGGDLSKDRITEMAFLRFDGETVQSFSQLINPQQSISAFITGLTGISNEMVANAPIFADVLPDVLPLLRGAILVAHNSRFDYTLLQNECVRAGVNFVMPALCTVKLSKALYPHEYKHSLDVIAQRFGLAVKGERHRALADVLMLADFLQAAFAEHESSWQNKALALFHPPALPQGLPHHLVEQVGNLSGGFAVVAVHFVDKIEFLLCEQAYHETVRYLKQLPSWQNITAIEQRETVGALHNVAVYAQWARELGVVFGKSERVAVALREEDSSLKAHHFWLPNGFLETPPMGLFYHPKAAKRAIVEWANGHGICLHRLGALPFDLPKNAACPAAVSDKCVCQISDLQEHNARILATAAHFPVVDCPWGRWRVRERDVVRGLVQDFVVERGALLMDDGTWFVHDDLWAVLKFKLKHDKQSFTRISV